MEKPKPEPHEPTPEKIADDYALLLSQLLGARERFVHDQDKSSELTSEQVQDACERFEAQMIEPMLAEYAKNHQIPWKPHPELEGEVLDIDASADTFIDPKDKKVIRYESTEAQSGAQFEIAMIYEINQNSRLKKDVSIESEELPDALEGLEHPALTSHRLPNGEMINPAFSNDSSWSEELSASQAREFVEMLRHIVRRLSHIYADPQWMLFPDTERARAYKIEKLT